VQSIHLLHHHNHYHTKVITTDACCKHEEKKHQQENNENGIYEDHADCLLCDYEFTKADDSFAQKKYLVAISYSESFITYSSGNYSLDDLSSNSSRAPPLAAY
jgi:hypothetical protein